MTKITVATTSLLLGYITGRAFEMFRHDGIRDLQKQLVKAYKTTDEIRQVLLDVQTARSWGVYQTRGTKGDGRPVLHSVDDLSFDNISKVSRIGLGVEPTDDGAA